MSGLSCGAPRCPACALAYQEARALPPVDLAAGLISHLARTGQGLEALSAEGRLVVRSDGLRRRLERRPQPNPCAVRITIA